MLAIIPARGGSKGLPGKNIKLLLGKPLIGYAIEAALRTRSISRVVVSTDCEEIAAVAASLGAEIPGLRPAYLATDDAQAIDTYLYEIEREEARTRQPLQDVAVLLPTTPLRTAADIDEAIEIFRQKHADSVVSYVEEQHPITWHRVLDEEQRIVNFWDGDQLMNRQAYPKTYYPNGAVYVFRTDLLRQRSYYSKRSYAYVMPRSRSVDIDTIEDFELAEFYLTKHA